MNARERKTIRQLTAAIEAFFAGSAHRLEPSGDETAPELQELHRTVGRLIEAADGYRAAQTAAGHQRVQPGHDPLSGLHNRAYFEEELARQEQGRQFPISIILASLDGLAEVNANWGKGAGDRLFADAARVVRLGVRGSDLVARYGDAAFAVLLPDTTIRAAGKVLERIREYETGYNLENREVRLGLSIGLATSELQGGLGDALILAEQRMNEDKEARRR